MCKNDMYVHYIYQTYIDVSNGQKFELSTYLKYLGMYYIDYCIRTYQFPLNNGDGATCNSSS